MPQANNQFPAQEEILRAEKFGAFDDALGQSVLHIYRLGLLDKFSSSVICERVHKVKTRLMTGTLPPLQKPRLAHGEFSPGDAVDRNHIYIPRKALCSGVGFFGGTNAGKTTTLFYWIPQVISTKCNAWIIEPYKKEWRRVLAVFQQLNKELVILRARDCKLNPLQAGKADPRTHLATVVDVLDRVLHVPDRARSILRQGCHELYTKFGIWLGNTTTWPCLFDLYEWIYTTPGLNAPARDAILDRLGTVLTSGQCLAYRVGWDPLELRRWSIVYELADASDQLKRLLVEPCLYTIYQNEYQRGTTNADLSLWIVIDDALHFLLTGQNSGGEITPLDELVSVVRSSGLGLAVLCQTTHGVSRPLMANLSFKMMGHLNLFEDYQLLGANMLMVPEQISWAAHNLRSQLYIGQFGAGEYQEPFVFTVPNVPTLNLVDDYAAANTRRALDVLPTVPAAEFANWQPHHAIAVTTTVASNSDQLSEVELRFLDTVIATPGQPSSCYAKAARMNGAAAASVRARLVTLGYLREHPLATGKRGRMSLVLEPLPKALTAVSTQSKTGAL